jgi:hypothetical protein
MSTAKFSTWLNPDGTENYKCRAWVNFNGTGTVAIRAAGNVASITDNGTGDYTLNFTTALPDANYAVAAAVGQGGAGNTGVTFGILDTAAPTTSTVRLRASQGGTNLDMSYNFVSIFR